MEPGDRKAGSSHASMSQACRNEMVGRSGGRPNGRQASKLLRQAGGCGRLAVAAGKLLRQASWCGRQAVAAGKHSSGMQADSRRPALCADQACSQPAHSGGKHGGKAGRQADGKQAGVQAS
jgi:hypothetical protein